MIFLKKMHCFFQKPLASANGNYYNVTAGEIHAVRDPSGA